MKESLPNFLPPEVEEGNVEYKLKLINPSKLRFQQLVTQMKWRLKEGNGEALYALGVEDNGGCIGLYKKELEKSKITLQSMANKLGASLQILEEKQINIQKDKPRFICEILVRKVLYEQPYIDIRIAVLGGHKSGKSTLLGVITHGGLDDGHGSARLDLFRHFHEVESGRTSSISFEILGFTKSGDLINYEENRTIEEIYENSAKLITFLDLAGFYKYQKTTLFGLSNYSPDYAMLVIDTINGLDQAGTSWEHLGIALALNLPIFIILSKIDLNHKTPNNVIHEFKNDSNHFNWNFTNNSTLNDLIQILNDLHKIPLIIENRDQLNTAARNILRGNVIPIIAVSAVTGQNLDLLKAFLQILPAVTSFHYGSADHSPSRLFKKEPDVKMVNDLFLNPKCHDSSLYFNIDVDLGEELSEFLIDEVFLVDAVPGCVVSGILDCGVIHEGQILYVGPFEVLDLVSESIPSLNFSKRRKFIEPAIPGNQREVVNGIVNNQSEQGEESAFKPFIITSIRRCNLIRRTLFKGECATLAIKPVKDNEIQSQQPTFISQNYKSRIAPTCLFFGEQPCQDILTEVENNMENLASTSASPNLASCVPIPNLIRKGMLLLHKNIIPKMASLRFEADICLLNHATRLTSGSQVYVFARNIRQTAIVEGLNRNHLKTGQSGKVTLRFIKNPEYIKAGLKLILREGSMRAIGQITQVFYHTST